MENKFKVDFKSLDTSRGKIDETWNDTYPDEDGYGHSDVDAWCEYAVVQFTATFIPTGKKFFIEGNVDLEGKADDDWKDEAGCYDDWGYIWTERISDITIYDIQDEENHDYDFVDLAEELNYDKAEDLEKELQAALEKDLDILLHDADVHVQGDTWTLEDIGKGWIYLNPIKYKVDPRTKKLEILS